jgi:hypothetical protein
MEDHIDPGQCLPDDVRIGSVAADVPDPGGILVEAPLMWIENDNLPPENVQPINQV